MCFDAALIAFRRGDLTEREYLRSCLAHFAGERHLHERFGCARRIPATDQSPVGESIRSAALNDLYIPLSGKFVSQPNIPNALARRSALMQTGTVLLERLYEQAAANDVQGLEDTFEELRARRPTFRSVVQPLAVFAASKGSGEALRFCLNHGATLQDDNVHAALKGLYGQQHPGEEAGAVRSKM